MSAQNTEVPEKQAASAPARNPYIMNFCKVLVEKKGEKLEPEELKKLISDTTSSSSSIHSKQKNLAGAKFGACQVFYAAAG